MTAENARCTCASLIPAGCRKSLGNEDIQPAYGWIRRGLMSMMLAERTGHEYHECEGDTLKPRRWRVYPDNQVDCKQPLRFVLDQLLGQH